MNASTLSGGDGRCELPAIAATVTSAHWLRRARPLLGTLVEIGVGVGVGVGAGERFDAPRAIDATFDAIAEVQRCLSRFDTTSDIARFHALEPGRWSPMRAPTRRVLEAARQLQRDTGGIFDISLGSGPDAWHCEGDRLHKLAQGVRLDLGGIGKGHAVDMAVQVLIDHGCAAGWVNAGGDLRAFGAVAVPIRLRDETAGGARSFATLHEGAFATSCFGAAARSQLARRGADAEAAVDAPSRTHVSVAAPLCLWADALTKVVAVCGDPSHPALAGVGAAAWLH